MQTAMKHMTLTEELVPSFTWDELERRLTALAGTPAKKAMVPSLVSGIRKQAWALPWEHVIDRILALSWVLNDETFQPTLMVEEEETLETP